MPSNAKLATSADRISTTTTTTDTDESDQFKMTIVESAVILNPFINDFVDCIENLPNRLQLVLTELRNVDSQVNAHHRKLELIKQEILSRELNSGHDQLPSMDQLLVKLHQVLLQCQVLGDQKVKLTGQVVEILSTKTRQLGLDPRNNERMFQMELDEEKVINDFKAAIKKCSLHYHHHHHYHPSGGGGGGGGGAANVGNQSRSSRHVTSTVNPNNNNTNGGNSVQSSASKSKNLTNVATKCKSTSSNSFLLTNNRNKPAAIDAYSFVDDSNNNNNTNCTSSPTHPNNNNNNDDAVNSTNESKSLRNLNSLSAVKKAALRGKLLGSAASPADNRRVNKKLKVEPIIHTPSNSSLKKAGCEMINNRPKRHLNAAPSSNVPSVDSRSLNDINNKKRRLSQFKSSDVVSSNQCKSPSSSSTASSTTTTNLNKTPNTNSQQKLRTKTPNLTRPQNLSSRLKPPQQQQTQNNKLKKKERPGNRRSLSGSEENRKRRGELARRRNQENGEFAEESETDHANDEDAASSQNDERNSNETESINHIDNDDLDEITSDNNKVNNLEEEMEGREVEEEEEEEDVGEGSVGDEESAEDDENSRLRNASTEKRVESKPLATANSTIAGNNQQSYEEEEVYCVCRDISYGNMIFCENRSCSIEWFHFKCVNLTTTPKGRWYCPQCRGDSHKVMRKVAASPHQHKTKNS